MQDVDHFFGFFWGESDRKKTLVFTNPKPHSPKNTSNQPDPKENKPIKPKPSHVLLLRPLLCSGREKSHSSLIARPVLFGHALGCGARTGEGDWKSGVQLRGRGLGRWCSESKSLPGLPKRLFLEASYLLKNHQKPPVGEYW